jgi:uncharacterized protein YdiU (UPF0061 family)
MRGLVRPIHEAGFSNTYVDELPGEIAAGVRSRQVPGCLYSRIPPTPVAAPRLLAWSKELGDYLGLQEPPETGPDVDVLAGNLVTPSMKPYAARYGGHQFGSWAGQLGDGRAITLGEVAATDGSLWEIQLKGAGPTPYSRRADGRAVLRSSLREFLCSEAMHWLGVPTTRALSLVATGDVVIRDMFYSGDPHPEKGAICSRVAPTFIRFGSFEILAALGETENLRSLADYVLRHHYPDLGPPGEETYLRWFEEVCRRTAVMIAHWMTVGFVHGVMNTDNMSVLGVTIDYGPYGWLEPYEPDWTPNTTDFAGRRYAFGQQPGVALWNLMALARALSPLLSAVEGLTRGLDTYRSTLSETYQASMLRKLGLQPDPEDDPVLLDELEPALVESGVDMTLFFRSLSHAASPLLALSGEPDAAFRSVLEASRYPDSPAEPGKLLAWLHRYAARLRREARPAGTVTTEMLAANPKYVPRNYLAQNAIEAADAGDLAPLRRLMHVLRRPFDEQPEHDELAAKRPDWARDKPGSATLSCSS